MYHKGIIESTMQVYLRIEKMIIYCNIFEMCKDLLDRYTKVFNKNTEYISNYLVIVPKLDLQDNLFIWRIIFKYVKQGSN